MPDQIRVAIIEDERRIRDGLRMLIDGTEGYCCKAAYASMEEALPGIGDELPNVVLIDIGFTRQPFDNRIGKRSAARFGAWRSAGDDYGATQLIVEEVEKVRVDDRLTLEAPIGA